MDALTIAATGMMAQQQRTEIVANNLSNMNTFGYQKRRVEFNNLLYKHSTRQGTVSSKPGDTVPGGIHSGMGVKLGAVYRVNEPGSLKQTGGSFDFAVEGQGFFQIQLPNGEIGFTRDGAFQQNETGTLVTHNGFPVQPGIVIPPNTSEITVSSDGNVQAKIAGTDEPVIVGQIQLALFPNAGGLKAIGDNLFITTEASGAPAISAPGINGAGSIRQGFVEASNVNAIEEVAALIRAERAYSMNSKVMSTADKMMASRR